MEKLILNISDLLWKFDLERIVEHVNKTVFVLVIFVLGYMSYDLNANEEQYMLLAKQFMDPDWIISRYLNEFPGTRLLYQTIIGFLLKYFSFEAVHLFFSLLLCISCAIPLAKIYKRLEISNSQILLHLPILFLFHQSLFAGSWMLLSVEPKGLAYVFILFALYYYMIGRFNKMNLHLIMATYFHVLVGAYVFIFLTICLLIFEKPKRKLDFVKLISAYLIVTIPFIIYLLTAVSATVSSTPNADWIYSYFRHPHHIGIFRDMSYFYTSHLHGVLLTLVALGFSFMFYRVNKDTKLKRLNNFVLLSLIGVLAAVVISYFDRDGVLIKYYPFRINTVTTFVLTLILTWFIFSSIKAEFKKIVVYGTILISLLFLVKLATPTLTSYHDHFIKNENKAINEMGDYIKKNTDKNAVVLSFLNDPSLQRRMERDRFVVYKFIPAEMKMIPEWYERELFKRQLSKNLELLGERNENYSIDYLLSKKRIDSSLLELVNFNGVYYLYKVIS